MPTGVVPSLSFVTMWQIMHWSLSLFGIYRSWQMIMAKERGEKKRALKCFNSSNWETAKNAARRRKAIQSDKFSNTSEEIRTAEGPEGKYYHSGAA